MANFIFLDQKHLGLTPNTQIIKAADYAVIAEVQQIIAAAQDQAAQIIKAAEAEFQAQHKKGYDQGLRQARKEMAQKITTAALHSQQYFHGLKAQTIELVMAVVKKVLQDIEPQALIVAQVTKALAAMKGASQVTLKVSPAVADTLNENLAHITKAAPDIGLIDIKTVSGMPQDDLIIESETGIVEAGLTDQLSAIEAAFRDACGLANNPVQKRDPKKHTT
jgi:type III secretion protein L